MKISAKAEYACLAVLELALRHDRGETVRLTEIAQPNEIPERFLVQILLQLKGAGYVNSVRGAGGGYRLAVAPNQMTLWDVVRAIDGPAAPDRNDAVRNRGIGRAVLREVWHEANRREQQFLMETDIAALVERARRQSPDMYYI